MKILRKLLGLLGALVVLSGCLMAGACNNDFSSVDNREDGILLFELYRKDALGLASRIETYELDEKTPNKEVEWTYNGKEYVFQIYRKMPDGGRLQYLGDDKLIVQYFWEGWEVDYLSKPGQYKVRVKIPADHQFIKPYTAVLTVTIREIDN